MGGEDHPVAIPLVRHAPPQALLLARVRSHPAKSNPQRKSLPAHLQPQTAQTTLPMSDHRAGGRSPWIDPCRQRIIITWVITSTGPQRPPLPTTAGAVANPAVTDLISARPDVAAQSVQTAALTCWLTSNSHPSSGRTIQTAAPTHLLSSVRCAATTHQSGALFDNSCYATLARWRDIPFCALQPVAPT